MLIEKCVLRTQGYAKEGINRRTKKCDNQERIDMSQNIVAWANEGGWDW